MTRVAVIPMSIGRAPHKPDAQWCTRVHVQSPLLRNVHREAA